jgi:hypothetical protein
VGVGDARSGRRDNGLHAAAYVAAGDVDPRVGEYLLDLLARDGIAAYLRPSSDLHPITRASTLPRRPIDRLYVDRDHLPEARDHLARLAREEREAEAADRTDSEAGRTAGNSGDADSSGDAPRSSGGFTEPTRDEVDKAFAEIVAGFGRTPSRGETRWQPYTERPAPEPSPDDEPTLLDGLDTFGEGLPDDDTERFVPPEAPPVPRPSLPTALAVIGVVGGLVIFLKPGLLSFLSSSLVMFIGFASVVAGFGTLVWRMRPGDDDTGPNDDGARV